MALVNVFMDMAFICGGIALGSAIITKFTHMDNSNVTTDAVTCSAVFAGLAIVGLLFV